MERETMEYNNVYLEIISENNKRHYFTISKITILEIDENNVRVFHDDEWHETKNVTNIEEIVKSMNRIIVSA